MSETYSMHVGDVNEYSNFNSMVNIGRNLS
jgi:hypothetical protein